MEIKIKLIEAEDPKLDSEFQAQESKQNLVKDAKARLRLADCSTLDSQILKDMCTLFKR